MEDTSIEARALAAHYERHLPPSEISARLGISADRAREIVCASWARDKAEGRARRGGPRGAGRGR